MCRAGMSFTGIRNVEVSVLNAENCNNGTTYYAAPKELRGLI